ncbi:MAG: dihydrodipicolinate synthase family protein [Bryobacteraceae bacterium]
MKTLAGIIPIVITPFHDDGRVDYDSQRRVVGHLVESGAHGLGLFGNASEGYTLSAEERTELMRVIVREVAGRVPLVVSSGHTGTDVAVQQSRQAEDEGADALMVLPPYLLKPGPEGIFDYFQAISNAVRIPIMVQDAPLMTQVAMGASLLARMAKEIGNVRYAKVEAPPTAPKISEVKRLAGDSLTILGGLNSHFLLEELGRGAVGTMPGSDMIPGLVRVWNLYREGRLDEARSDFNRHLPLIRYELQPGLGVSVMKHNFKAAGIIASARVRQPTQSIDAEGVKEVETILSDLRRE